MKGQIMSIVRVCLVALSLGVIALVGGMPSLVSSTTRSAPNVGQVLYDGSLNTGTPDTQGFVYATQPFQAAQATQSFAGGVTTLDTTPARSESAGYFAGILTKTLPTLNRMTGYTVRFTVQITSEQHVNNDRAGFSIIALSSDHKGIELGFWKDHIWAQNYDGTTQFTHGEDAEFNTTAALTAYDLTISGDTYTLRSGGNVVLTGNLRNYSGFGLPYNTPNFLFLGDNTSSAQAKILFSFASLTLGTPATPTPTITATSTPPTTTATSTAPTATSNPSATPAASATPAPQTVHLFLPALMKAP
jgi:hypothetical protein